MLRTPQLVPEASTPLYFSLLLALGLSNVLVSIRRKQTYKA